MPKGKIRQIKIGDSASLKMKATKGRILAFAKLSKDMNPVHIDPEYARNSRFKKIVAHGALSLSLVSAVLGNKLPGNGTVYLSQTANFILPVFLNDTVTATVTVKKIKHQKLYSLETRCENQKGQLVMHGQAVVLYQGG